MSACRPVTPLHPSSDPPPEDPSAPTLLVGDAPPEPEPPVPQTVAPVPDTSSSSPPAFAPRITSPGPVSIEEEQDLALTISVDTPSDAPVRVSALDLPPGAEWRAKERTLRFHPDATQGGREYVVRLVADNRHGRSEESFPLTITDSIRPPQPRITGSDRTIEDGIVFYDVDQQSDDYLDSRGYAGRHYPAVIAVPDGAHDAAEAHRYPVHIFLHGVFDHWPLVAWYQEIRVQPSDRMYSSWFGYSETLPDGAADPMAVREYTTRRVLHLLAWVLATFPGADPERVYIEGGSMGGYGSASIALRHARHIAYAVPRFGGIVPRLSPDGWRRDMVEEMWGQPDDAPLDPKSAWDAADLTRVIRDVPEARHQFLFREMSTTDAVVHFGTAIDPSPFTCMSYVQATQRMRVGHFFVWHTGEHGHQDPRLPDYWWTSKLFNPMRDNRTLRLARNLAFLAFTRSSCDDDPTRDTRGAMNRFLEWDTASIDDSLDRFAVRVHVIVGEGEPPPFSGAPSVGDVPDCPLPITVDVTPRRTQRFQLTPGEIVGYRFGATQGELVANEDGSVTVPALAVTPEWTELVIERRQEPRFSDPLPLATFCE